MVAMVRAEPRLGVLLVVVDDLRPELHTYGVDAVHTPHLDAFAERGVRFNNDYCQYPLCNPSTASFLTGGRPDELELYQNKTPFRRTNDATRGAAYTQVTRGGA